MVKIKPYTFIFISAVDSNWECHITFIFISTVDMERVDRMVEWNSNYTLTLSLIFKSLTLSLFLISLSLICRPKKKTLSSSPTLSHLIYTGASHLTLSHLHLHSFISSPPLPPLSSPPASLLYHHCLVWTTTASLMSTGLSLISTPVGLLFLWEKDDWFFFLWGGCFCFLFFYLYVTCKFFYFYFSFFMFCVNEVMNPEKEKY